MNSDSKDVQNEIVFFSEGKIFFQTFLFFLQQRKFFLQFFSLKLCFFKKKAFIRKLLNYSQNEKVFSSLNIPEQKTKCVNQISNQFLVTQIGFFYSDLKHRLSLIIHDNPQQNLVSIPIYHSPKLLISHK